MRIRSGEPSWAVADGLDCENQVPIHQLTLFQERQRLLSSAGEEKYSLALNPLKVSGPWIR